MISSFSQNFIFLKTRKTGGTSVALVLSSICKEGDVLSPLYAPDEEMRRKTVGLTSTDSFCGEPIRSHMTASSVKRLFPNFWYSATKISIERHPYEKVVSRAYWSVAQKQLNPEKFLRSEIDYAIEDARLIDREIYCIDGRRVDDIMLIHDDLDNGMKSLSRHFNKDLPALPASKSQFRLDHRPAQEILTDLQMKRIYERTAFEFGEFGFQR